MPARPRDARSAPHQRPCHSSRRAVLPQETAGGPPQEILRGLGASPSRYTSYVEPTRSASHVVDSLAHDGEHPCKAHLSLLTHSVSLGDDDGATFSKACVAVVPPYPQNGRNRIRGIFHARAWFPALQPAPFEFQALRLCRVLCTESQQTASVTSGEFDWSFISVVNTSCRPAIHAAARSCGTQCWPRRTFPEIF